MVKARLLAGFLHDKPPVDIFIQQLINGLVLGSMYALVALGYTMVYGIINLINFAHGEVLMVGALVSWTVVTVFADCGLPGWVLLSISLVVAMLACMALNFLIEKLAYRPLRNATAPGPADHGHGHVAAAADAGHDHLEAGLQAYPHLAARRAV